MTLSICKLRNIQEKVMLQNELENEFFINFCNY